MIGASHSGGRIGSFFADTLGPAAHGGGVAGCAGTRELLLAAQRSAAARQQALHGWRFWARVPLMPFLCLWWALTYQGD